MTFQISKCESSIALSLSFIYIYNNKKCFGVMHQHSNASDVRQACNNEVMKGKWVLQDDSGKEHLDHPHVRQCLYYHVRSLHKMGML
jgi:hypothetical protein